MSLSIVEKGEGGILFTPFSDLIGIKNGIEFLERFLENRFELSLITGIRLL